MYYKNANGRTQSINQQYLKKVAEMYERNHPGARWNDLTGVQQVTYYHANVWRVKK